MNRPAKRKTSVSLSEEVVRTIDRLAGKRGSRSAVIEEAVRAFWAAQLKGKRDAHDRAILDSTAARLNAEAEDVLGYQVES
jgi:Arc/MetJ-type ribon-helix-helix transcriptional regulator